MSNTLARNVVEAALANDPRTANLRIVRVEFAENLSEDALSAQSNDDLRAGLALPGTKIRCKFQPDWEGTIVETKVTNYIVERTNSKSGRGKPGKLFRMKFTQCELRD